VIGEEGVLTDFAAIDVETANEDRASICQIGVAIFEGGRLANQWKSYINPEDDFSGINVSIHHITADMVCDQPTIAQIEGALRGLIGTRVLVCHTCFDRLAIHQAFVRYRLSPPSWVWLDSARVARRAWDQFAHRGYGLQSVCAEIGYNFICHDALEDAKAAAEVVLAAIRKTGISVEGWIEVLQTRNRSAAARKPIACEGDATGPLHGEVIVFTGALRLHRSDAAVIAAKVGCDVAERVTKDTTLLVVGDQDIRKLAGHEKSSKHRRAEELISQGCNIRILRETDFDALVGLAG
jgi:DNA polymerase-3 subunit epsilon